MDSYQGANMTFFFYGLQHDQAIDESIG
jgi:hypothetical protein